MAKDRENLITLGFRGRIGNVVFREINGKKYSSKAPDRSKVKYNKEQKQYQNLFSEAAQYASAVLHDPQKADQYLKKGIENHQLYHAALTDFHRQRSWKMPRLHPDDINKYLNKFPGLTIRQTKAVKHLISSGKLTNAIYQRINNISKTSATRELHDLVNRNVVIFNGVKGAGAAYVLPECELTQIIAKRVQNGKSLAQKAK